MLMSHRTNSGYSEESGGVPRRTRNVRFLQADEKNPARNKRTTTATTMDWHHHQIKLSHQEEIEASRGREGEEKRRASGTYELRFGEGREPALVAFSAAAGDGRISPSAEEKNQQEESECLLIKGDGFWSS